MMGALWSKWRKKKLTTTEVLETLDKDIQCLEKHKQINVERQKRTATQLMLSSVIVYIVFALALYFYYMPDMWLQKILYSSPLLFFPVLIWLIRKFLHWYFVKRIRKNELALEELQERKTKILDEVMETETYKKAKEILERFAPERTSAHDPMATPMVGDKNRPGQELRQRKLEGQRPAEGKPSSPTALRHGLDGAPQMDLSSLTASSPELSQVGRSTEEVGQLNPQQHRRFNPASPPGPPMPRLILPRERSMMDRLVEYLVGDGPQNRFALVCRECRSHNGMALREEFEYICFRCCYCYAMNPARKHKPKAPPLTAPTVSMTAAAAPLHSATSQQTQPEPAAAQRLQQRSAGQGPAVGSRSAAGETEGRTSDGAERMSVSEDDSVNE